MPFDLKASTKANWNIWLPKPPEKITLVFIINNKFYHISITIQRYF